MASRTVYSQQFHYQVFSLSFGKQFKNLCLKLPVQSNGTQILASKSSNMTKIYMPKVLESGLLKRDFLRLETLPDRIRLGITVGSVS